MLAHGVKLSTAGHTRHCYGSPLCPRPRLWRPVARVLTRLLRVQHWCRWTQASSPGSHARRRGYQTHSRRSGKTARCPQAFAPFRQSRFTFSRVYWRLEPCDVPALAWPLCPIQCRPVHGSRKVPVQSRPADALCNAASFARSRMSRSRRCSDYMQKLRLFCVRRGIATVAAVHKPCSARCRTAHAVCVKEQDIGRPGVDATAAT